MKKLIVVLFLVLLFPITASAQFGLTPEQIGEIIGANQASVSVPQFTFDYTVSLSVSGDDVPPVDVNLSGAGSLDVLGETGSISIDGAASVMGADTPLNGEIRIIGETAFARFTDPSTGADSGWFEVDLAEADIDPNDLTDLAESQSPIPTEDLLPIVGSLGSINPEDFIGVARSEDGSTATYTAIINLGDLVTSEGFQPALAAISEEAGVPADMLSGMLTGVFAEADISAAQRIDTASGTISGANFTLILPVDMAAMGAGTGTLNMSFVLDVSVGNYGQPAAIEAPADAQPLDPAVLGALGG